MADTHEWLQRILAGEATFQLRDMASKGLVPFPAEAMLQVLALLSADSEVQIRSQALATAKGLPREMVVGASGSPAAGETILRYLLLALEDDDEVLRLLAANPALPEELFLRLCHLPRPEVLEILALNQGRLRNSTEAMVALIGNVALPLKLKGYLIEERERQRRAAQAAAQAAAPVAVEEEKEEEPQVVFDEVLTKDFEKEEAHLHPVKREEAQQRRSASVYQLVRTLNAGEKLILAMKGNKEARYLLVRDTNKQVATKVLESPRIGDTEVEMYAKMTNVCNEVLRGIANTKEWMGKYSIMKALIFNPKTPIDISLPMVPRLMIKDLGFMAKNRNVPEVIRTTAARLARQRREQRTG